MVKMEISQILRRGLISSEKGWDTDNYPGASFGYREIVVDLGSAEEDRQNAPVHVQDTALPAPTGAKRVSESLPLADSHSSIRNAIFILAGVCTLVLIFGTVILLSSKRK